MEETKKKEAPPRAKAVNIPATREQVKAMKKEQVYISPFPNRRMRRGQETRRNERSQIVPAKYSENKWIPAKKLWHKKVSNLPRLYPGMSRIKSK